MRVIAGSARGRRLHAPAGSDTRPTSDRVREALFSILGPPEGDAPVLDLFAGAGSLGIEALSRGAPRAIFVDRSRAAIRCVQRNLSELGLTHAAEVHGGDAIRFAGRLPAERPGLRFQWIFLDPPYAGGLVEQALAVLGGWRTPLLCEGGLVVAEHDRRSPPAPRHGHLVKADVRRYGDTELSFYRVEPLDA